MLSFPDFPKRPTHFFLALCMVLFSYTTARSQDCGEINQMEYGVNHWVGHAYQLTGLTGTTAPPSNANFFSYPYEGKLTEEMLSLDTMHIDLTFDESFDTPYDDDYFLTTCDSVKQSYFGITFRSKFIVPDKGMYLVKINQDD